MTEIVEIKAATEQALGAMKELVAKQDAEIKAFGEASKETAAAIKKMDASFVQMAADHAGAMTRLSAMEAKGNRPNFGGDERKSLGQLFTESAEFKGYDGSGNSQRFYQKDISNAVGSAADLRVPFVNPTIYANPDRPMFVSDLLRKIPVATDSVRIMRENVFTNNAAIQAGQLVAKGKSDITYTELALTVETIAHYIIASRQILDDVPRLQAMIDSRLQYGVNLKMDQQILYGAGGANNFTGMLVDAAVQTVGTYAAPVLPETASTKKLDHFRKALTKLQQFNFYNATGAMISPEDWEALELAKGTDGHYIWTNVNSGGETRLWRVPVVVSNALTGNDFLVGDFTQAASLYTREGFSVRISESHANLFVENGIAILGEERAAFGIELPKGICKGKFAQT